MNMNFYQNTQLFTGKGCVQAEGARVAKLGARCVVVTSKTAAKKCGALTDVTSLLDEQGILYELYNNVGQNPAMASCMEAGNLARTFGADFVIGIGGGSAIDAAKAAAVIATNTAIDHTSLIKSKFVNNPLPVVAVGTTAGTGAEVTGVAVITDYDGEKKSLRGHCLYPVLAYGDPSYTMSLSDYFTRSTAIDTLAHCVESYFNQNSNEISSTFAVRGVQLVMDVFAEMAATFGASLTYEQREKLYYGSLYGGYALTVTSTVFPHGVGLYLSENHGVPHGLACGIFQPYLLSHCCKKVPERYNAFFKAVGMTPEHYLELLASIMPKVSVCISEEEILALESRWESAPFVTRTPGGMPPEKVTKILCELFISK